MDQYLKLLKLNPSKPSVEFLRSILEAHHFHVPYENISKIFNFEQGTIFPTLDQYLEGIQRFGFGGTCFVRNFYLSDLLSHLGFKTQLLTLESNGIPDSHCNVLVDDRYIVDLGLMSTFVGPFDIHGGHIKTNNGLRVMKFLSNRDQNEIRIEIYRGEKLHRYFKGTLEPKSKDFFDVPIQNTYAQDALFMKTLRIFRLLPDAEVTLWDRDLYTLKPDGNLQRRKLETRIDLENAVAIDLKLPQYPIATVIDILNRNAGKDIFT